MEPVEESRGDMYGCVWRVMGPVARRSQTERGDVCGCIYGKVMGPIGCGLWQKEGTYIHGCIYNGRVPRPPRCVWSQTESVGKLAESSGSIGKDYVIGASCTEVSDRTRRS